MIIHNNALQIHILLVCFTISAILPDLLDNFENASAEVVQCPDLTQPPFNLASEGELLFVKQLCSGHWDIKCKYMHMYRNCIYFINI